jgi:MOSC domain-containing protein YiiM
VHVAVQSAVSHMCSHLKYMMTSSCLCGFYSSVLHAGHVSLCDGMQVKDPALKHSLTFGVGYIYETMAPAEQSAVTQLFSAGAIQVHTRPSLATVWVAMKDGSTYPSPSNQLTIS